MRSKLWLNCNKNMLGVVFVLQDFACFSFNLHENIFKKVFVKGSPSFCIKRFEEACNYLTKNYVLIKLVEDAIFVFDQTLWPPIKPGTYANIGCLYLEIGSGETLSFTLDFTKTPFRA